MGPWFHEVGNLYNDVACGYCLLALPILTDSFESSLKINQSLHVPMNKFEKLPVYKNRYPIVLDVILNILLTVRYNVGSSVMIYCTYLGVKLHPLSNALHRIRFA